jgi:sterol desaturase/sphingolipid hydroxylase (fatty acid hydroxylase superfamily)
MRPIPNPIGLSVLLIALALVFFLLQKLSPARRGQKIFRRGFGLDVLYWYFTPFFTGLFSKLAVILTVLPIVLLLGFSVETFKHHLYRGFGPLATQPIALQAIEIFLIGDLIGYWMHRLFHGKRLWPFHAVHHSSTEVDWLSSVRLHPLNEAVTRAVEVIPLFLLGFNPTALAAYVPALTLYAVFLHANVNWSFGRLRYVVASPLFHRWHHSKEAAALDKNFAGFFVLWDVIFGTFYFPAGKTPIDFGVTEPIPETLWGQLAHPFRREPAKQS